MEKKILLVASLACIACLAPTKRWLLILTGVEVNITIKNLMRYLTAML